VIGRFLDWLGERYRHYARIAALGEGLVPDVEPARGFVQRLRDRSIERRALHAMIAANGEGIAPRLVRVAAAPAIDDDTMIEERPTPHTPSPRVFDPPLVAMGYEIAQRMASVMSNTRLLSQLQLIDQYTVLEIHGVIVDIEGQTPGNAVVLDDLQRIAVVLSTALRASGNLHRLQLIAEEAPAMRTAVDYLGTVKPDDPQPGEGYLPLSGGDIVGELTIVPSPPDDEDSSRVPDTAWVRRNAVGTVQDVQVGRGLGGGGNSPIITLELLQNVPGAQIFNDGVSSPIPLPPGENSARVPNTAWVQARLAGILTGLHYFGTWNASTGFPALPDPPTGVANGTFFVVDVAGNFSLSGISDWAVGDLVVKSAADRWEKIPAHLTREQVVAALGGEPLMLTGGTMTGALRSMAHFETIQDGLGLLMNSGAIVYKRTGGGLALRQAAGNLQPQIENNDGSNRRDIIDRINGDALYGVGPWQNCPLQPGVSGRCQVRKEQNGTVARVYYWFSRGGANVGTGAMATMPGGGFGPSNGVVVFVGANKSGQGDFHVTRLNSASIDILSGGATQDANGEFTYRCA
jgi:hypothetical protein